MPNIKVSILRIIAFIFISVLVISMLFALNSCFFVKDPDIVYQEFPMEITYEINDVTVTLKEIYVVEYSGFNPELGYSYKGYIQSTGEDGFILYEEDSLKLICKLGDADYYIGRTQYKNRVEPRAYRKKESFFYGEQYFFLDETELYDQYGIKIISWTTSDPLENYYK